jgi:hypothetical protein
MLTIVSASAAALIAVSAAVTVAPTGTGGPAGYSYEGTWPTMAACVNRAVFLERNYGIQTYECDSASNDASDTSTYLWVKWA